MQNFHPEQLNKLVEEDDGADLQSASYILLFLTARYPLHQFSLCLNLPADDVPDLVDNFEEASK